MSNYFCMLKNYLIQSHLYLLYRLKKEAIRMKKTSKTQVKDTRYRKLLKDRAIFGMETSFEV